MKPRTSAIVALFLWLLPAAVYSASQPPPYHVDSWQVDDGLPQSSVLAIIQTHDGYLWLGTAGGLVRFDGTQFKVFTPNNSPGLPSNRILSLYEDHAGTLWIGTIEGYLIKYSGGRFQSCSPAEWVNLSGYIQNFAETSDGELQLLNPYKELVRYAEKQPGSSRTNIEVLQTGVNFLAADPRGRVWTATDKEVGLWKGRSFVPVIELAQKEGYSPVVLAGARGGGCWVAENGRLRKFVGTNCTADYGNYPWPKGNVVCMLEDRSGLLWVGTYGSGVYCYGTNGVPRRFSREEGLHGPFVRSLCEDREGNIWVGSDFFGLSRIKPVVVQNYGRDQGLAGDCVLSVCEGEEGELWIGLIADGLDRLKDGVFEHYGTRQGLPNDYVDAVLYDRNHSLWAGTWGGGLCRLEGNKFVPYANPGECSGVVCALYEDTRGSLWVGQQRAEPEIVHLESGKPEVLRLQSRLAGTVVRTLTEDKDGGLWIGTQGDGIYKIKDGRQWHFGRNEGLSNEDIRSLFLDGEGALWIGTFGGGLNRYLDGKFTSFTTRNGLVNDSLGSILEDAHGNLWCASLAGVFRVSKAELNGLARGDIHWIHCLQFTKSDGLPSLECTGGCQPSACKTRDGRLIFPTLMGLAVVDPEHIFENRLPPPVMIEEMVIDGKERTSIFDISSSNPPNRAAEPLRIPPDVQGLEFHFAGLSFTAPEKVQYKYRLKGAEESWVEAGTRRVVNYRHLQPGPYNFQVQACNNDGVWNEQGASMALIVLPHYWQTWWFKVICGSAVVLVFVAIYEIRLASERKLARVRLRIASDLHDEVGSNLGSIALLSEMVPKICEEADEIRRVALETVSSLREIVWFLDPAGDNMNDLILRMKDTARTMLPGLHFDFVSELESTSARPSLHLRRNIFPMYKEILHNIAKHAQAKRVDISVKVTARQFQLLIRDDGTGFDETKVRRGNGLKNLRRRAADLRGELEIQTGQGRGTCFIVTAPIT